MYWETIRKVRRDRKMTQSDLERESGVSRRTIQKIESGGQTTIGALSKICACLGLELIVAPRKKPTLDDMAEENRKLYSEPRF